jgi:uncharacterized membrane-anchored protein
MNLRLSLSLLAVVLVLSSPTASAEQAPIPRDQAALEAEYRALHWESMERDYDLPKSNSHLKLPQGFDILMGADAERLAFLDNGVEFPQTEAILYEPQTGAYIFVDYFDDGFVDDDDWSDIDPADFLQQMQEGQRSSNKERVANGQEAFEIVGWVEPPTYDTTSHVAHYVVEMGNERAHWVNAVAVKLGREGHHEVTWVGPLDIFKSDGPRVLKTALDSHSYDDGHRYADFKDGDKVAAYGIAGLVAAVAGVKLSKGLLAGLFAFLAIAGKKLAILVVPAAIGIGAAVKRFLRRGN